MTNTPTYHNLKITKTDSKISFGHLFLLYICEPIVHGLVGFSTFFSIIVFIKYLAFLFNQSTFFNIVIEDLKIALIGFIIFYLIKFIQNTIKKN
ncbi:MAG: hypothetical protein STSR0008_17270 [Ignavibacterium sp.]